MRSFRLSGRFVRFLALAALALLGAASAKDFNADSHPDLLWSNTANGSTFVWYMNGPALVSDAFITQIDPSWKIQGIADFNGDGHPDIVWRNTANGDSYVWYMNGSTFISDAFLFSLPPEWTIQGVADFNADGKPDFLMRNTNTGVAFAWFFNNNVPVGDQFLFGIDPVWLVEAVADLNADAQPDLLFRNQSTGLAFVWNTQYTGGTLSLAGSSAPLFGIDPVWQVVQMEDWNGDNSPDLLFRNKDTGVVFVWYMISGRLAGNDFITQIDPSWEIVPRAPDLPTTFDLSGFPSPQAAGAAAFFTLTARDPFGDTVTRYRGTVHFASSDPLAVLPADYTFTAADNGSHRFPATLNTPGTQSITATDVAKPAVTGGQSPITVGLATTSTALTRSAGTSPSTFGSSVTFTAIVSGGAAPTGTVTFKDNGVSLGAGATVALSAGSAQLTISTLAVGTHSLTATYNGDGSNAASTSNPALTQAVSTATPTATLSLGAGTNPSTFGDSLTFTAVVSGPGGTPTGTVTFKDNAVNLGAAVALSAGVAQFPISSLAAGAHSITATYNGDASYAAATSNPALAQTVNKATPAIAVTSSSNPTTFGGSVTFTATMSGPGGAPTGTVTFKDGAVNLGAAVALSAGVAQFSTSSLGVGAHSITAAYNGDSSYLTVTSSPALNQTVNKATSTIALASSSNPSTFGGSVTFTATVSGPGGTPTGTVTFKDGVVNLGAAVALSAGVAQFSTSSLGAGVHSITAVYNGDSSYLGVTSSPALNQTVNQATPAIGVTSGSNPSTFGGSVTFTATVSASGGTPTGTVTFKDGVVNLGAAVALSGGVAQLSTSSLGVGAHSITAVYSGDSSYLGVTSSPALTQTVNKATSTIALASSSNPSTFGGSVTFTATVSASGGTPTGTVTFKDNGVNLAAAVALSGGVAQLATSSLSTGVHSITATHNGDASYLISTSSALSQTVN